MMNEKMHICPVVYLYENAAKLNRMYSLCRTRPDRLSSLFSRDIKPYTR